MPFSRRRLLKTGLLAPAAVIPFATIPADAANRSPNETPEAVFMDPSTEVSRDGAVRERLLMDFGWRFHLGHADDVSKDFNFGSGRTGNFLKTGFFLPAGSIAFDDSDWRPLNLPHDWAIELPFENDPTLDSKGYYPLGRNYPATSVGWYRRVFELNAGDVDKRITLEFDGAYREAVVVLNGVYIGRHSGGYDPFSFDVTDFANPGGRNTLLIRVDATSSDGWFYEGAGIYRHVWLVKTNPVHVRKWGTFVSADIRPSAASLTVLTEVQNDGSDAAAQTRVSTTILDPAGKAVGRSVSAAKSVDAAGQLSFTQQIDVARPALWSLEQRNMYTLVSEVRVGNVVVDRYETPFGIRSLRFDAEKGFFLNGKAVKVKGTCNHQDHAGFGVALPDAVQYYRVRKLQEMGCNALRTVHNPPAPELLKACDELGMLVLDETRMMSSNPEGLSQFENLIRRDRNHPSVFMWSMGNEEGMSATEKGVRILTSMKALAHRLDGTRPVTLPPTGVVGAGALAVCDIVGYNYMDPAAAEYHNQHPEKPVLGTEIASAVGTRGIYITDAEKGYVSSYDVYTTTGRASAEGWWRFCTSQPWLIGGFVWTGFDYRGEPSPNSWPNISSQYGIIDTCGFPKDVFFYYQSWWTERPVLHLFPHWNWPGYEGKEIAVWVYSDVDKVELFLNGISLGSKDMLKNRHLAWNVAYQPGVIEAKGYRNGALVLTAKRETTGPPAALYLSADRTTINANGEDVAMFAVEVRDAQGRQVPVTDCDVTFTVEGSGGLAGTGNGDPTNHQPDRGAMRRAFSGLCMGLVQSIQTAGEIHVRAESHGLTPATLTISAQEGTLRPQLAPWERKEPTGQGITGLWRPVADGNVQLYTFVQQGSRLAGSFENGTAYWSGGSDVVLPITDGAVSGDTVTFRAGTNTYKGTFNRATIRLERIPDPAPPLPKPSDPLSGSRPAIGPDPDGSDPSRYPFWPPQPGTILLRRVMR